MENRIPCETSERFDVPRARAREGTLGQAENPVFISVFMNLAVIVLRLLPLWVGKVEAEAC